MKKYYVVPAEIIDSNFTEDEDIEAISEYPVIYMKGDKNDEIMEAMGLYLCNDEDDYDKLIRSLKKALKKEPDSTLDYVKGIEVWEKSKMMFTVKEFCDLVGIK